MYTHDCQDPMSKKVEETSQEQSERFQMRASKEFMRTLDEWRRLQPDLPGRAEAIRRLTALALEAEAAKKKGKR
jgi:hypothetical protein